MTEDNVINDLESQVGEYDLGYRAGYHEYGVLLPDDFVRRLVDDAYRSPMWAGYLSGYFASIHEAGRASNSVAYLMHGRNRTDDAH